MSGTYACLFSEDRRRNDFGDQASIERPQPASANPRLRRRVRERLAAVASSTQWPGLPLGPGDACGDSLGSGDSLGLGDADAVAVGDGHGRAPVAVPLVNALIGAFTSIRRWCCASKISMCTRADAAEIAKDSGPVNAPSNLPRPAVSSSSSEPFSSNFREATAELVGVSVSVVQVRVSVNGALAGSTLPLFAVTDVTLP